MRMISPRQFYNEQIRKKIDQLLDSSVDLDQINILMAQMPAESEELGMNSPAAQKISTLCNGKRQEDPESQGTNSRDALKPSASEIFSEFRVQSYFQDQGGISSKHEVIELPAIKSYIGLLSLCERSSQ
jgi:hypothetical protein